MKGVKQGDVLPPILFALYTDELLERLEQTTTEASSTITTHPYNKSASDHTFSIITSTTSASSTHYKSRSPTELLNQSLICSPT